MANDIVVAVFNDYAEAERARSDLVAAGIERNRVDIASNENERAPVSASAQARGDSAQESEGLGERISGFFSRLFGGDDTRDEAGYYSEAIRRGGAIITVNARNESEADVAADVLDKCGAVDVQERAHEWRQSGWAGSPPGSAALSGPGRDSDVSSDREKVIPVVREELQVGKRRRDRGGVRIYSHMEEEHVEENVRLRDEHATVDRRSVDRPATTADMAAFKEGTIEVRETTEEPVVAKKARVVEEVVVGKETTERVESVNDVVRRTEVDVERLDADRSRQQPTENARAGDLYDEDYRTHWESNYREASGTYDDYQPAYRYGSTLGQDQRYRGRDWSDIETDARRDWETHYPTSPWDRFKAAVRHGWERVAPNKSTGRERR